MKKILIETGDSRGIVDITELNRVEYEKFLEAMLKLNSAYIKALRKAST